MENLIRIIEGSTDSTNVEKANNILVKEFLDCPEKWWLLLKAFHNLQFLRKHESSENLVLFTPDYAGNPYQRLMYNEFKCKVLKMPDGILDVLKLVVEHKYTALHLHWVKEIFRPCTKKSEFDYSFQKFRSMIKVLKLVGVELFWTVHNKMEHDQTELGEMYTAKLMRFVALEAEKVHVHFNDAKNTMTDFLHLHGENVDFVVEEHPMYQLEDFNNYLEPSEIAGNGSSNYFLALGMIRPYKRIDMVARAVRTCLQNGINLKIIFAGSCQDKAAKKELLILKELYPNNVELILRTLKDSEVNWLYHHTKCSILSYSKILTSGSYYMAATHAKPSIAPDIGMFESTVVEGSNGFKFDSTEQGLVRALEKVSRMSPEELVDIGAAAKQSCTHSVQSFSNAIHSMILSQN